MKVYLVGGAVRDELLGYPVSEHDWVVVGATPETLLEQGFDQIGKDFPVFLHPQTKDEYALARTERKTGPGYRGFSFYAEPDVTLEQDLERRDLTINAIAKAENGQIIDPFHGQRDLQKQIIRHVSNAFREDPVRILRVARFAARYHHLGFNIADETMNLMRQMVKNGETDHLVSERVWKEFSRALKERSPAVFINVLDACGALKVIMPEIEALIHASYWSTTPESFPITSLQRACELSTDPCVRFASMFRDIDGRQPDREIIDIRKFASKKTPKINALCDRLSTPNDFRDLCVLVIKFYPIYEQASRLPAKLILQVLTTMDALRRPQRFKKYLTCCQAYSSGFKSSESLEKSLSDFLELCLQNTLSVSTKALSEKGLSGHKFGEALAQKRIERLNEIKKIWNKENSI